MEYMRMTSLIFHPLLEHVFINQVTGQECLLYISTGTSSGGAGLGKPGPLSVCIRSGDPVISPGSVLLPPGISHFYLLCYYIIKTSVLRVKTVLNFCSVSVLPYDCGQITEPLQTSAAPPFRIVVLNETQCIPGPSTPCFPPVTVPFLLKVSSILSPLHHLSFSLELTPTGVTFPLKSSSSGEP